MFFCVMNPAGAHKFFGDSRKREAVRGKLKAAFESLTFGGPGGNPLSCADDDYDNPCWAPLSVDPYDWRTYQYKNHHVKGFGVYEYRVDDWFEARGDGSDNEPTQETLYECVYAERAARLRTPKAYPKPGNTLVPC